MFRLWSSGLQFAEPEVVAKYLSMPGEWCNEAHLLAGAQPSQGALILPLGAVAELLRPQHGPSMESCSVARCHAWVVALGG